MHAKETRNITKLLAAEETVKYKDAEIIGLQGTLLAFDIRDNKDTTKRKYATATSAR